MKYTCVKCGEKHKLPVFRSDQKFKYSGCKEFYIRVRGVAFELCGMSLLMLLFVFSTIMLTSFNCEKYYVGDFIEKSKAEVSSYLSILAEIDTGISKIIKKEDKQIKRLKTYAVNSQGGFNLVSALGLFAEYSDDLFKERSLVWSRYMGIEPPKWIPGVISEKHLEDIHLKELKVMAMSQAIKRFVYRDLAKLEKRNNRKSLINRIYMVEQIVLFPERFPTYKEYFWESNKAISRLMPHVRGLEMEHLKLNR